MTNIISKYKRIPLIITFQETSQYKDTYAGEIGTVALTAHLLKPENSERQKRSCIYASYRRRKLSAYAQFIG